MSRLIGRGKAIGAFAYLYAAARACHDAGMALRSLRLVAVFPLMLIQPAVAGSPSIFLFDVLHRPLYRAAYQRMLRGERDWPDWMAKAEGAMNVTANPGVGRV